jgi:hypothetical protein
MAHGMQTWNYDPSMSNGTSAPTQGTVYAVAVPYNQGQVVTYINFHTAVAASGTAPTHIFCGLADSTGKMLAQTGEEKSNAGWALPSNVVRTTLAAPYTIPVTGLYYHVFIQVGAFSVTQPTLNRVTGAPAFANASIPQVTGVTTGQSALPANGSTIAGGIVITNSLRFWSGSE